MDDDLKRGSLQPSPSHHLVTTLNRERPDLTAYNRSQRTARFPVNTRESEGFRTHSATTKIGPEPSKGSQVQITPLFPVAGAAEALEASAAHPGWLLVV